ncbi:MAG TPA: hypothetical protein ENJ28_07310 [Gammaproteobacteria bacterium]|nr:hypothetical protein [Gammaproteobacteria bacterium]
MTISLFVYTILLVLLPFNFIAAESTGIADKVSQRLLFPPEFLHHNLVDNENYDDQSMQQLMENINKIKNEYLQTLDDTSAFQGLYLNGGYSKDISNDTDEYFYGLEWELYDNGRQASRRVLDKRKLESRLQFLQQLRQMYARRKESQLSFIKQLEDRLDLYIADRQSNIIAPKLKKARQQLKSGFITQVEYNEWELKNFKISSKINYLRGKSYTILNQSLISFLNNLETAKIKNHKKLSELAIKRSVAIKIQNLMSTRSSFLPKWEDNLSLSLFVEQRRLKTQTTNDMVGVRLRVPLGANSNRDKIIKMDKKIYRDQIKSVKKRLQQRLNDLTRQFLFQQQRIQYFTKEYDFLKNKIATLNIQKKVGLPSLSYTSEKDLPLQKLNQINVLHNALKARLTLYKTVIELEELVTPDQRADLFE